LGSVNNRRKRDDAIIVGRERESEAGKVLHAGREQREENNNTHHFGGN
jgi:hypothetical protein